MIWGVAQANRTKLVRRYDSPRAQAARRSPLMSAMKTSRKHALVSFRNLLPVSCGEALNPSQIDGDGTQRARSIAGCDALRRSTLTRFCRSRKDAADIWGRLCMPRCANRWDKRIAATTLCAS
jgi:hypothetical protein